MTFLRKRFIEDMQLHGYCQRTVDAYVRAVRQLAEHYHKSPDKITEEELRQYFLYNKNIRKWSRVASTISLCGIKFFFEKTLHKEWTTFKLVRPPKEKKLPPILSLREVRAILNNTRMDYHRACLTAIYSLGLRLQEGTNMQVALKKTNITKSVSVRHLRHAYAVHLLEAGVEFRFVQEYLGHSDPRTTMIYTSLINKSLVNPVRLINKVMADL